MNIWVKFSVSSFAPLILILPPRSREAGDAPGEEWTPIDISQSSYCIRLLFVGRLSS